jgi:superfamily II DNA or RNA helicase
VDVARRICKQLSATLPNIGVIGGGKNYFGDRITVFTAGSVHKTDGDCDFLLCDEAHLLMTGKTAIGLGEGWRFARNFGFTATPGGRMDGAHAMLECFFGREIFKLSYADAAALGLVVPIHVRWLPMDFNGYNPARDKVGVPQMRWGIWRNDIRNQKIAEDVKTTYPPDKQILILVATIDHAVHLWQNLQDFSLVYGSLDEESIEQYKRNRMLPENFEPTTPERREQMRQAFEDGTLRRVIATDVWSTGVDFAKLQVIYRCDARSSEVLDTQAPGRVSRIHPASGKQVGEVIDCADMFDASLHRKAQVRKRHYAALGWTQDWPLRERSL